MTNKISVASTLLATTFLAAANLSNAQADEITNRLDIRFSSALVSLDNNTYTVTFTPDTSSSFRNEPLGSALMVVNVDIPSINNSTFINNTLNSNSTTTAGLGGAVALMNLNLNEMKNTKFINNTLNSKFTTSASSISGGGAMVLGATSGSTNGAVITEMDSCVFQGNKINGGSNPIGGAIVVSQYAAITNMKNTVFDENSVYTTVTSAGNAQGGALFILGKIENIISSTFQNNRAEATNGYTTGGAISNQANNGNIKLIDNTKFINNSIKAGNGPAYGGAIASMKTIETVQNSLFSKNTAETTSNQGAYGGAMYLISSSNVNRIDNIEFSENRSISSAGGAYGGALTTTVKIGELSNSVFSKNSAEGYGNAYGGAIYSYGNNANLVLVDNVNFNDNSAISKTGTAVGGAIANTAALGKIRNSSFSGNQVSGKANAMGGAIYTSKDMLLEAENYTSKFSGNTVQIDNETPRYNAIHAAAGSVITLNTMQKGAFWFDDALAGGYSLKMTGDGSGAVQFNNEIAGASAITIENTAVTFGKGAYGQGSIASMPSLALDNATVNFANGYLETVEVSNYAARNNSYLHMDVNPDTMQADKLIINGNVSGTTKLVIHATSDADIRNKGSIVFAQSANDNEGSANSFEVFRVFGSPYLYNVVYAEEGLDKEWKWEMNDTENPDKPEVPADNPPSRIEIAPEVMAYRAIIPAALEQTRSMVQNISNKVSVNKLYSSPCNGLYDECYNGSPLHNVWVNPIYFNSTIKNPVHLDADIWGLEAGFDIQQNINHKLGVFASYRHGDYDLNGKGQKFYSLTGSDIDIDSYIGGLYYRYDKNTYWAFATVYGGIQKADLKTDDGIKTDTDGTQFGAAVQAGKAFALSPSITVEPSLGVFYTQVDFDDIQDNFGKNARYDTIRQTEIEAGISLEKTVFLDDGAAKFYIKPSIIQPITSGDSVLVAGLGKVNAYDDNLLGRGELGLRSSLGESLSGYVSASYTFGSDYRATAFSAGLNYAW